MNSTVLNTIDQKYRRTVRDTLINIVSVEIERLLKENINKTVYSLPQGSYQRTYAMLNSIASSIILDTVDTITIEIGTTPETMGSLYPSVLNADRTDNREYITEWLNNGTSGSPYYNHNRWDFIGLTQDNVEKIVHSALSKAFTQIAFRR